MAKAYLNALAEEGTRQDLINWIVKLDAENDALRDKIMSQQKAHGLRVEARQK